MVDMHQVGIIIGLSSVVYVTVSLIIAVSIIIFLNGICTAVINNKTSHMIIKSQTS